MADKTLIIEKITPFEYYKAKRKSAGFRMLDEKKLGAMLRSHKQHKEFTDKLVSIIKSCGASYDEYRVDNIEGIDYSDYSIIITSGGDGTFLKAAEKVNNQLMIGANSTYKIVI